MLCILVYVPGIGTDSHGSSRWLALGPIQFQPSEIAKLVVILFLAVLVEKLSKNMGKVASLVVIGDVRLKKFYQISIAVAEGAIAALNVGDDVDV